MPYGGILFYFTMIYDTVRGAQRVLGMLTAGGEGGGGGACTHMQVHTLTHIFTHLYIYTYKRLHLS